MSDAGLTHSQKILVVAHAVLALLFSFLIPPFEAQDEPAHVRVIHTIVTEAQFPRANSQAGNFFDQSHQPPLYYVLAAGWSFALNWRSLQYPQPNLFGFDASNRAGYRLFLPTAAHAFPWQGTDFIIHFLRLISVLLSTLTVLVIAKCLRGVLGPHLHAIHVATAFAAFNPQFIFVGAIVNNDVLVNLFGAVLILMVARAWPMPQLSWRFALGLGLVLGLSLWAKRSALSLVGFVFLACAWHCWRNKLSGTQIGRVFAALLGGFGAASAPLLAWNRLHHGAWLPDRDPTDKLLTQPTANLASGIESAWQNNWFFDIFTNAFKTFWGAFGWSNLRLPELVYDGLALVCGMVLIGYAAIIFSRSTTLFLAGPRSLFRMLGVVIVFSIALPTYRAVFFHDPQLLPGRYLFVSMAAIAACLGVGWAVWLQRVPVTQHSPRLQTVLTLGLVAANALLPIGSLFGVIQPAFAPKFVASEPNLRLGRFDESVEVAQLSAQTIYKQDPEGTRQYTRVQVTWRALQREEANLAFGIAVLGKDNEVLGQLNVFPSKGNYPGPVWQPGATFQDEYDILLDKPCAQLPALGKIQLSVFRLNNANADTLSDVPSITPLQMRDAEGRIVAPILGRFRIDALPNPYPIFWREPTARFDDVIGLRDPNMPATLQAGGILTAAITYELLSRTPKQAVVFIHVLDSTGQLVAQDDHEPLRSTYPTDLWSPGECSRETFTLAIPVTATGPLSIVTGIYSASDQQRFQATARLASTRIITSANTVLLGEVEIK